MNARGSSLIAVLAVAFVSQLCAAQEITVAAAADLQFAMQDIAARFQKEKGKDGEAHLRFIRELLPADSERCSL
jgi:ABC-type molybdate transport system substrate-binding protein